MPNDCLIFVSTVVSSLTIIAELTPRKIGTNASVLAANSNQDGRSEVVFFTDIQSYGSGIASSTKE